PHANCPLQRSFPTRRSSDLKAYERQRKRKQISCPVCGDCDIDKALMAPAVARSRESQAADERARARAVLQQLAALRRHVEQNCEDRKSTRLNSSHVKISYAV